MFRIRPVEREDYLEWLNVYQVYAAYYGVELSEMGIANTWSWLMDIRHVMEGIVAESDGEVVGLAHFRAMPSPLRGQEIGFLDDVIVLPEYRSYGIGEGLLEYIRSHGAEAGWGVVRWITRDNNYSARRVYDRVAKRTNWVTYEMDCYRKSID